MSNILGADGTYNILKRALDTASLRQKTISNNIANINTPNYKAKRLVFDQELRRQMASPSSFKLKVTNKRHIGSSNSAGLDVEIVEDNSTNEPMATMQILTWSVQPSSQPDTLQ